VGNFGLQPKRRTLLSAAIPTTVLRPVSHEPSRKEFFAKLLGGLVAFSFVAKAFTKSPVSPSAPQLTAKKFAIPVRPAPRTVARRVDSL
jgi:hypothetical protein